MSRVKRWLNWTPRQCQIMETSPEEEPTKPSKLNFVGFDGSGSRESPIIGGPETPPASVPSDTQIMADSPGTAPTKPTKLPALRSARGRPVAWLRPEKAARGGDGLLYC